jgi:hypothetical protein
MTTDEGLRKCMKHDHDDENKTYVREQLRLVCCPRGRIWKIHDMAWFWKILSALLHVSTRMISDLLRRSHVRDDFRGGQSFALQSFRCQHDLAISVDN